MDVVAVIMMVALPMTGVISMSEALEGLSDPSIVLIAALFVIGEALVRTGAAQRPGDWLTARAHDLIALPVSGQWFTDTAQEIGMAQMIVPPTSRLIGRTVTEARFRSAYGLSVIDMKHGVKPAPEGVIDEPLRAGDTLLTLGPWRAIR